MQKRAPKQFWLKGFVSLAKLATAKQLLINLVVVCHMASHNDPLASRPVSPPPGILTDADVLLAGMSVTRTDEEFREFYMTGMGEFRLTRVPVDPRAASILTPLPAEEVIDSLPDLEIGTTRKSSTRRMVIKLGKVGSMDFVATDIFTVDGCTIGMLDRGVTLVCYR